MRCVAYLAVNLAVINITNIALIIYERTFIRMQPHPCSGVRAKEERICEPRVELLQRWRQISIALQLHCSSRFTRLIASHLTPNSTDITKMSSSQKKLPKPVIFGTAGGGGV